MNTLNTAALEHTALVASEGCKAIADPLELTTAELAAKLATVQAPLVSALSQAGEDLGPNLSTRQRLRIVWQLVSDAMRASGA